MKIFICNKSVTSQLQKDIKREKSFQVCNKTVTAFKIKKEAFKLLKFHKNERMAAKLHLVTKLLLIKIPYKKNEIFYL